MRNAIVLAAGKGTRMKSSLSKVMHPLLSKPMIGDVRRHQASIGPIRAIITDSARSKVQVFGIRVLVN